MFRGSIQKGLVAGLALVLALMPVSVSAQSDGAMKVGVFNADRILAESQMGQQAIALMEQLQTQRMGDLQAAQNQLNAVQQRLATAPADSFAVIQRQFQDGQIRMQRLQEDVQNELQQRQAQLTQPIIVRIAEIVDQIGADESFTMIFNAAQSGLVYVDEALDITERVITALDAAAQAGGAGGG